MQRSMAETGTPRWYIPLRIDSEKTAQEGAKVHNRFYIPRKKENGDVGEKGGGEHIYAGGDFWRLMVLTSSNPKVLVHPFF